MSIEKYIQANTEALLALTAAIKSGNILAASDAIYDPAKSTEETVPALQNAVEKEGSGIDFDKMTLEEFREPFAKIMQHQNLGKNVLRNIVEEFGVARITDIPREQWHKAWASAQELLEGAK